MAKGGLRAYKKAGSHNAGQGAGEEVATQPGPCQEGHSPQHRHIASQFVAAQVQVLQQHNPLVLQILGSGYVTGCCIG